LRSWLVVAVIPILAHVLSLRQLVTGWPSQVLVSALVLALYGLSVFAVVLEPAERRQLRRDSRRFLNVVGFLRAA
jgi:hypothetical protein